MRHMEALTKHTVEQVLDAVEKGITKAGAARVLGVHRHTMIRYAKRWKAVAEALEDRRVELVDLAEMGLRGAVLRQEPWAITFVLRTLGRDQGYGDRIDIEVRVRQMAVKMGLDPDEVVAEAQRILREMRRDY